MPSCESCDVYLAPNAVNADGSCPTCGDEVDATTPVIASKGVPWHFWLILVMASLYLGWRAIEGVIWVVGRLLVI